MKRRGNKASCCVCVKGCVEIKFIFLYNYEKPALLTCAIRKTSQHYPQARLLLIVTCVTFYKGLKAKNLLTLTLTLFYYLRNDYHFMGTRQKCIIKNCLILFHSCDTSLLEYSVILKEAIVPEGREKKRRINLLK